MNFKIFTRGPIKHYLWNSKLKKYQKVMLTVSIPIYNGTCWPMRERAWKIMLRVVLKRGFSDSDARNKVVTLSFGFVWIELNCNDAITDSKGTLSGCLFDILAPRYLIYKRICFRYKLFRIEFRFEITFFHSQSTGAPWCYSSHFGLNQCSMKASSVVRKLRKAFCLMMFYRPFASLDFANS